MADSGIKDLAANATEKLKAPKKISQFERQRQEAEAKRQREEEETQRALRDFEESFGADEDDDDPVSRMAAGRSFMDDVPSGPRGAPSGPGGPRHLATPAGPRSSGPGSLGPPPSLKRKRELEAEREAQRIRHDEERMSSLKRSASRGEEQRRESGAFGDRDDDMRRQQDRSPEPAVRKPTMLLSCLPSDMTENAIRDLMPSGLKVESLSFVASPGNRLDAQRTLTAILTTAAHTAVSDVDKAVKGLDGKYIGSGCYLKISRHISSTGDGQPSLHNVPHIPETSPFGCTYAPVQQPRGSLRNAPPPNSFSNVPPPSSFAPTGPGQSQRMPGLSQVTVRPPNDIKELQMIHRTVEQLLTYGTEFEAALMSQAEIRQDEKWAWLYDSTSKPGVYYRWLLWKCLSEDTDSWDDDAWSYAKDRGSTDDTEGLFDSGPIWLGPKDKPRYETVMEFEELAEDEDYVSSEDEEAEQTLPSGPGVTITEKDGIEILQPTYLNPYRKAKLTHLLARLPDSIATLRAGDVARVTNFVVNNASQGAEEIVDMLIWNVEHPFRHCVSYADDDFDADGRNDRSHSIDGAVKQDNSNLRLIGLYLISDALQATRTSGVRDAWKYRTLFESALRSRQVFENLGSLEKEHQWGRMKAEQWKRKVGIILDLWEQWDVFTNEAQEHFKQVFANPPLSEEEQKLKDDEERREKEEREKKLWKSADAKKDDTPKEASGGPAHAPNEQTKDKIQALKDKIAAQKAASDQAEQAENLNEKASGETTGALQQPRQQQQQQRSSSKRNRPTAADLLDASESSAQDPYSLPKVASVTGDAAAVKLDGFSFSLSSSTAVPAAHKEEEVVKPVEAKVKASKAIDMFDSSDDE